MPHLIQSHYSYQSAGISTLSKSTSIAFVIYTHCGGHRKPIAYSKLFNSTFRPTKRTLASQLMEVPPLKSVFAFHPDSPCCLTMVLLTKQVFCGWKEHFHQLRNLPDDVNCTQRRLSTTFKCNPNNQWLSYPARDCSLYINSWIVNHQQQSQISVEMSHWIPFWKPSLKIIVLTHMNNSSVNPDNIYMSMITVFK